MFCDVSEHPSFIRGNSLNDSYLNIFFRIALNCALKYQIIFIIAIRHLLDRKIGERL